MRVIAGFWLFLGAIAPTEIKDKIATIIPISIVVDIIFYITMLFAGIISFYGVYVVGKRIVHSVRIKLAQSNLKERCFLIRKPTKQIIEEKPAYDFSSFDASFNNLQRVTEPETKTMMLNEFQPKLRNLCYDSAWSEEKRVRIEKVLDYIPESLSNDPNIDHYLHFLGLITHRDREHIINMVKEKFLYELEKLYNNPKMEANQLILPLLQNIHEYSEEYMMKLVDDAGSITQWSCQKFQCQGSKIELWKLGERDNKARERVLQYLRQKMNDAERKKDTKSHERLIKLYYLVNR
jgi:hypothetical protein